MKTGPWTPAELRALQQLYPDTPNKAIGRLLNRSENGAMQKAHKLGLKKSAAFMSSELSGRIAIGNIPHNKGQAFNPGGRSAETRFKQGEKPTNTLPIGTHRLNKEGHLQRKINDKPGNDSQRWRTVAEIVWVHANGPLPPKHIVVFRPGMFSCELELITIDKVECISLADNARRNHAKNKSPELAKIVQLKGQITRQVNRIKREASQQQAHP